MTLEPVRPLTRREFSLFRELVEQEAGIHLSEVKQALVNARLLGRIRELGLATFSEYYERVIGGTDEELVRCIDAICTNETHFFREPAQFALLEGSIMPRWRAEVEQGRRAPGVRVWSAACSSGEEPYSVAMLLKERLPAGWPIEVLATDLSTKVLRKAVAAVYPMQRFSEIPAHLRQKFVLRGVREQAGNFRIAPEIRELVRCQRLNLVSSDLSAFGSFDLVMCRNVLMYFKPDTRRRVVSQLLRQVARDGHMMVGHSESLHDFDPRLKTVIPAVYRVLESAA